VGYYQRLLKIENEPIGSQAWATTIKLNIFMTIFITLYYHDFYKIDIKKLKKWLKKILLSQKNEKSLKMVKKLSCKKNCFFNPKNAS
jgi:F0F1-type ATP synthase membrane subunit a